MPERHRRTRERRRHPQGGQPRYDPPQWAIDLEVEDIEDLGQIKGYKARRRNWPAGTLGQDLFAYKLLGDNGFFLDIGCANPEICGGSCGNNTYTLEKKFGWKGLLFDIIEQDWPSDARTSEYFKVDVRSSEFSHILGRKSPELVDYISFDVDESTIPAIENFMESTVRFKAMTFEHDWCRVGHKARKVSRELLLKAGYFLLFADVTSYRVKYDGLYQPVEDWWVDPQYFDSDVLDKKDDGLTWQDCILKL